MPRCSHQAVSLARALAGTHLVNAHASAAQTLSLVHRMQVEAKHRIPADIRWSLSLSVPLPDLGHWRMWRSPGELPRRGLILPLLLGPVRLHLHPSQGMPSKPDHYCPETIRRRAHIRKRLCRAARRCGQQRRSVPWPPRDRHEFQVHEESARDLHLQVAQTRAQQRGSPPGGAVPTKRGDNRLPVERSWNAAPGCSPRQAHRLAASVRSAAHRRPAEARPPLACLRPLYCSSSQPFKINADPLLVHFLGKKDFCVGGVIFKGDVDQALDV